MKRPIFIGVFVSLLVALSTAWLIYNRYSYYKEVEYNTLLQLAFSTKSNIETHINNAKTQAKTLAFIVENYGEPKDFDYTASQLLDTNSIISAIELTDSGVIKKVYPYLPNKAIIGYDILSDTNRNIEALIALRKNDFYFSGPFALKQGGFGIVGRMPILIDGKFEGFSAVVINFDTLLSVVRISEPRNNDLIFQISKISPYNKKRETFIEVDSAFVGLPFVELDIPIGSWKLKVGSKDPIGLETFIGTIFFGLLSSLLSGIFATYLAYLPSRLSKLVALKTEELVNKQKALSLTLDKLQEQNKRLRELTWMHSHIIRAPIARLLGLTQMLKDSSTIDENDKKVVEYIKQSSHEFDEIIRRASEELEKNIHQ